MKLNLNDMMRGRLTSDGAAILNREEARRITEWGGRRPLRPGEKRQAGELYQRQVWQMMDDFGNAMAPGGMMPFIAGEIEIVTPEVRRDDAERDLKRRMYRV